MIKQATVEDVANSRVTKRHGRIVVTTCYYPRFLKRKLVDDYEGTLAPTRALLKEFKTREEQLIAEGREPGPAHDDAFLEIRYQDKFALNESGLAKLREYADLAQTQDVYFVCHCRLGQRCHRDLLLMMARELYGASVGRVYLAYPEFESRLKSS